MYFDNITFYNINVLFILSKILGLFPYDKDLKFSKHRMIYSLLMFSTFAINWLLLIKFTMAHPQESITNMCSLYAQLGIQVVIVFTHLATLIYYKEDYDTQLQYLPTLHAKYYRINIYLITGTISIASFYLVRLFYVYNSSWSVFFLTTLSELRPYLIVNQFLAFSHVLQSSLRQLNNSIEHGRLIDEVMLDVHSETINQANTINKLFSWQMLLSGVLITFNFTCLIYYSIFDYFQENIDRLLISCRLLYSIFQVVLLYQIADGCEKVTEQAELFNRELFNQLAENKCLCSNEELKLYAGMRPTVKFTARGFFDLDYPLVTKVIATATTYLVILIQFTLPVNHS